MYLFVIVLVILVLLYIFLPEEKYKKVGIILSLLAIFSLFAFRNDVGMDDQRYRFFYEIVQYNDIENEWELSGVEWSYRALSAWFSAMGLNYKSIFLFYAFSSFCFLFLIIKELKMDKNRSFLFLMTFMAFCVVPYITVMRSFLAAVIVIYTILKFTPKQFYFWIPMFILAAVIHRSGIFFFPLIFIKNLRLMENRNFLIFTPVVLLIANVCGIWQTLKAPMLNLGIEYANYIGSSSGGLKGTGIVVLVLFILYVVYVIIRARKRDETPCSKMMAQFSFLFFSLYYLTFGVGFLGRISYTFLLFEASSIILLYGIVQKESKVKFINDGRLLAFVIAAVLCFVSIYNVSHADIGNFSIDNYSMNFLAERRSE